MISSQRSSWLTMSIFCSQINWSYILKSVVPNSLYPFLESGCIKNYYLEFSYTRGDNIRLAVYTHSKNAMALAKKIDDVIVSQFSQFHSLHERKSTSEEIFMDFPENSVHYGLFKVTHLINEVDYKRYSNISKVLSDSMLQLFSDENIDNESIITFAYILNLYWLRVCRVYGKVKDSDMLQRYYHRTLGTISVSQSQSDFIKAKYYDNVSILKEIYKETFSYSNIQDESWMSLWIECCSNYLLNNTTENMNATTFVGIPDLISKHLGIHDATNALLLFMVNESFSYEL